jgi:hypothetical protein
MLAVSRTVDLNDVPLKPYSVSTPFYTEVFEGVKAVLPEAVIACFPTLKSEMLKWHSKNKSDVVRALYTDPPTLESARCGHHDMYLSNAFQLGVDPRSAHGVNIGAMTGEEAVQHLISNLGTLLCHEISHREMLVLEATLMNGFVRSTGQKERFAFLLMWLLVCVRLSPHVTSCSPFYREVCSAVSLPTGAQSICDEVEKGRLHSPTDSELMWSELFSRIRRMRYEWNILDGESLEHEEMFAQLVDLDSFAMPGEDITDAGRRLYQFYVENSDENGELDMSDSTLRPYCREHGTHCKGVFCVRA